MAELTDEEVIDAMQGAGRRMTYVVANILRMTHKHHNGTLGTAKVLRRLKALEKRGEVERVRSDYAVQICWRLTHNALGQEPCAAVCARSPGPEGYTSGTTRKE